jgi:hypothetical protein
MKNENFVSARKLLLRGKSGPLRILTVGDAAAGMFVAAVRCPSENTKFVGRGESLLGAVENAILAYNAGCAIPDAADDLVQEVLAKEEKRREDAKSRIILPN